MPFRTPDHSADHARARELAALRVDESLPAADDAWLEHHLVGCDACSAIEAAYAEQRRMFQAARTPLPQPPRDLWARTAAAIEAESRPRPALPGIGRSFRLSLAPIAAVLVVAVVAGSGLLNGIFPPRDSTTKGPGPEVATPIPLVAGDVQVLTAGDGGLNMDTTNVDGVCPIGADSCGTKTDSQTQALANVSSLEPSAAILSPAKDRIVVVQRDTGSLFVVAVGTPEPTPTPSPTPSPTPTPTPSPTPTATPEPSESSTAPPASPSVSPEAASPSPSAELSETPSESPSPTPTATATPAPTPQPTATPSLAVTPRPDGAIEIASNVVLVGNDAAYSADGTRFAFSARPSDGTAGPDVFVWTTGDTEARPVTSDHASQFSAWVGDDVLVSRVVDGRPQNVLVDPSSGSETPADGAAWRPAIARDGKFGVWWQGSVEPTTDGRDWQPGNGQLVVGAWPSGEVTQVISRKAPHDWQVRWTEDGSAVAVWRRDGDDPKKPGALSLYRTDPATGAIDLDHPLLADTPAFEGFAVKNGHLVLSGPEDGGDTVVKVYAWDKDKIGQVQVLSQDNVTVVR